MSLKDYFIQVYLNTVGPGSPEELVPFQSWGLGHVLGVDQVFGVEHREVGQLLREISRSSLQRKHSLKLHNKNIFGFPWKNLADLMLNIGSRFCRSRVFLSSIEHSAKSSMAWQ